MKTWKKAVKEYYRFNNMGKNDFTYRKYFDPLLEDKDINALEKLNQSTSHEELEELCL